MRYPGGRGVQEGNGQRAADQKEERREAPPPQHVASPIGPWGSVRLGGWDSRRCGGRCAGLDCIVGRSHSGPSPPSHGIRSGMSSTRSGVGLVWSGRGGEGKSPCLPPRWLLLRVAQLPWSPLVGIQGGTHATHRAPGATQPEAIREHGTGKREGHREWLACHPDG